MPRPKKEVIIDKKQNIPTNTEQETQASKIPINEHVKNLGKHSLEAAEDAGNIAIDVKNIVVEKVVGTKDAVIGTAKNIKDAVAEKATDAKDTVKDTANTAAEKAADAKDAITQAAKNVKDNVEKKAADAKDTVKKTVTQAANTAAEKVADVTETVKKKVEPTKIVMPKWKGDVAERLEDCFKFVVKDLGISLCNPYKNNTKVESSAEIGNIGRYTSISARNELDFCLNSFAKKDAVDCSKISEFWSNLPTLPITTFIRGQAQCINSNKDVIKIPLDIGALTFKSNSIGAEDNKFGGCKVILRDFNPKEGDKIDLTKFVGKSFSDLKFYDGTMNKLPLKIIDINEPKVAPQCLIGVYNYDEDNAPLTAEAFIFSSPAPTPHLHTEL